jgi:hypothetical protein
MAILTPASARRRPRTLKHALDRLAALLLLCLPLLAAPPVPPARAEALHLYEQEIKAGMIYNFLKYTAWPSSKVAGAAPIVICLFGGDPFGGYLDNTQGRTVNQHPIQLRNISRAAEAAACHLLVVDEREKAGWPALGAALAGKGVLTVGDYAGFARAGGMIEFGRKDNRISVSLNIDAVRASQLTVEDRLLRLVTVVHGPAEPGP